MENAFENVTWCPFAWSKYDLQQKGKRKQNVAVKAQGGVGKRRAARAMAQKTSSLGSTIAERVEQHNKTKNKTHSADLKRSSLRSGMALAKTKRKTKRGKEGWEHQASKGQQLSGRSTKTKRKQNTAERWEMPWPFKVTRPCQNKTQNKTWRGGQQIKFFEGGGRAGRAPKQNKNVTGNKWWQQNRKVVESRHRKSEQNVKQNQMAEPRN